MAKHKDVEYGEALFQKLQQLTAVHPPQLPQSTSPTRELRKMKKFRFQLLHRWLTDRFAPARIADIAGGKGLLAYLMQQSGWQATVIDPTYQPLIDKYKDIHTGQRMRITASESVPHISQPFLTDMGESFDLLVGMHAHGCNTAVIDAAARYGCGFVLFPCCVIDEPLIPPPGVEWVESLTSYALAQNLSVTPFRLNFKGQNIGLFHQGSALTYREL